jgi:hypothetical protein
VVHSIAQQQSVPFTALSLAVHQGVLAATFTACATSDGDCSELLFDTEAEQLGDSTGYKGMRVWSMNLDTEFADPWMRRMNTGMSADSLALSAEGPLRLVYRSYSNGPLSIYADLENPTSSSQARLDVQPDNSDLKLGSLASFSEGEALVVGTFRGDSLSYKPTWGSTEVLSPDDPGVPSETRRRGFMVRLGTAEEIPPYHEIASSRDVVLLGASEQERNGSPLHCERPGRCIREIHDLLPWSIKCVTKPNQNNSIAWIASHSSPFREQEKPTRGSRNTIPALFGDLTQNTSLEHYTI